MKTLCTLIAILIVASVGVSHARIQAVDVAETALHLDVNTIDGFTLPATAFADTVWFGGSGLGNGSVVRGGLWDWEVDSGEAPEYFLDGDPVGNQFRDGWAFTDATSKGGPSRLGSGHFRTDGTYDFDDDTGSFVHRATTHANDGVNDGPDPLDDPVNPAASAWSVWIGTNLYLNPEHCGWAQTAGYGNGWSQGLVKQYSISGPMGTPLDIEFFHRYAIEAGFDTCWVETSYDGIHWDQVGSAENPNGIFNGGDRQSPMPMPAGAPAIVQLGSWPGGTGAFFVRFRVAIDGSLSDENGGGDFLYAWQLDDISLRVGGIPQDFTDFENGYGGWEPRRCEGFDFEVTLEPDRAAGRIVPVGDLLCPLVLPCPEACGLEGNVLIFCDKDDCNLGDSFMSSFAATSPFSIGGPENPDIDGFGGRIFKLSMYLDGGAGLFEIIAAWCVSYWPFDVNHCPYSPTAGAPGYGEEFNWSRSNSACGGWYQGVGPNCYREFLSDMSTGIPADADSVIVAMGVVSYCRSEPNCDLQDNGAPFYDNAQFGVFDPAGASIGGGYYSDNFPLAEQTHQGMPPHSSRSDGSGNFPAALGIEIPLRHVRADTAVIYAPIQNAAAYLRWKVVPGPCQDLGNPFFAAYPTGTWNEARMEIGLEQGPGTPDPNTFMTCFHESEPNNDVSWGGERIPLEPCDDILPDGVFSAGTTVHYFFEVRDEATGEVIGTAPSANSFAAVDTLPNYASLWREFQTLPELIAPAQGGSCDPNDPLGRANNLLVVNDSPRAIGKTRLQALLDSFGLDYDWYDVVGTAYPGNYNGIGRREDRPTQPPRPPVGGATETQLDPYDCILYYADITQNFTLDDQLSVPEFGGHPAIAMQKLEGWLMGCSIDQEERLLMLSGYGWASDIDVNTSHGPAFLELLGVDVLDFDYAAQSGDLRRCARLTGVPGTQPAGHTFDGEILGTGCPEGYAADILAPIIDGETVVTYVNAHEGGSDPIDCADDTNLPGWAAIIRKSAGLGECRRSVAMGVSLQRLHNLNCSDECLFDDWTIGGGANSPAQLFADLFEWANKPIGAPIAAREQVPPALRTRLIGSRPNPANPSATITFSLATTGEVRLRLFTVSGRLMRTLIDGRLDAVAGPYEVVWDGRDDAGRSIASGVFFYQLDAPGYSSAKKLILLK